MDYCTVDDVMAIATDFKRDLDVNNNITTAEVEAIITESSNMVNMILQPNYAISTIEGFDPTFPPVIVYLTATYSSILLHERFGATSVEKNEALIDRYDRSMTAFKTIITNGALVDSSNVKVPVQSAPVLKQGEPNFTSNDEIKELYENGRFY